MKHMISIPGRELFGHLNASNKDAFARIQVLHKVFVQWQQIVNAETIRSIAIELELSLKICRFLIHTAVVYMK